MVVYPPKTTVSVLVPCAEAERILLAVFTSATSVQDDPFHDSLFATLDGGTYPDEYKAAVAIPEPAPKDLPVFKSATSVHDEPFQTSFVVIFGVPPKNNALVLSAPHEPAFCLLAFIFATSVQDVPFHDSLLTVPGSPPNPRADV